MRAIDDLFHGPDEIVRCHRICGRRVCTSARRISDVVDTFEEHQPFHAGHAEHIAIEPCERIDAGTVGRSRFPEIPD
jgi:hypothetical protein